MTEWVSNTLQEAIDWSNIFKLYKNLKKEREKNRIGRLETSNFQPLLSIKSSKPNLQESIGHTLPWRSSTEKAKSTHHRRPQSPTTWPCFLPPSSPSPQLSPLKTSKFWPTSSLAPLPPPTANLPRRPASPPEGAVPTTNLSSTATVSGAIWVTGPVGTLPLTVSSYTRSSMLMKMGCFRRRRRRPRARRRRGPTAK